MTQATTSCDIWWGELGSAWRVLIVVSSHRIDEAFSLGACESLGRIGDCSL